MTDVISFENALKLKMAGCDIPAEKAYRYYTKSFKETTKEGIKTVVKTWEEWDKNLKSVTLNSADQQKRELSDRFYDSWNDDLAYAYSTSELACILEQCSPIMIMATTPPDEAVKYLIPDAPNYGVGLNFEVIKKKLELTHAHF